VLPCPFTRNRPLRLTRRLRFPNPCTLRLPLPPRSPTPPSLRTPQWPSRPTFLRSQKSCQYPQNQSPNPSLSISTLPLPSQTSRRYRSRQMNGSLQPLPLSPFLYLRPIRSLPPPQPQFLFPFPLPFPFLFPLLRSKPRPSPQARNRCLLNPASSIALVPTINNSNSFRHCPHPVSPFLPRPLPQYLKRHQSETPTPPYSLELDQPTTIDASPSSLHSPRPLTMHRVPGFCPPPSTGRGLQ